MGFDPARAFEDLKRLCRIGPRFSGSEGMRRQRALLIEHFETKADRVELQAFEAEVSIGTVPMVNLVASWNLDAKNRLLVAAHYDTRPIADADPFQPRTPILGANDGASGVAVLMELSRLDIRRTDVGIDFVLFDGEECIFDPERDSELLGSLHFAEKYQALETRATYLGAIVLDMVGGSEARFQREANSYLRGFELQQEIWLLAEELGCERFDWEVGLDMLDDHLSLLDAGIPAVDLIDMGYPQWHTLADTWENCSAQTLGEVGRVVEAWLRAK